LKNALKTRGYNQEIYCPYYGAKIESCYKLYIDKGMWLNSMLDKENNV